MVEINKVNGPFDEARSLVEEENRKEDVFDGQM
jgi:hypothetical protein